MRIPYIPDMRDLDHLTVSGDVRFGEGVVLKVRASVGRRCQCGRPGALYHACGGVCCAAQGTVIIVASEGSRIDIPDGSVLEDKVITGNLRILEH